MSQQVDRNTTTPFLLKLFYRSNKFHRLDDFTPTQQPSSHLQIYTWPTCSLRELTHLVTSALPNLLPDPAAGTRIAFRLIYPDTRAATRGSDAPGRFLAKDLGSVIIGEDADFADGAVNGNGERPLRGDADKMLQDAKFVIGDWVACVVMPPLANGDVAPPPEDIGPPSRSMYGGGRGRGGGFRENGFGGGSGLYRGGGRGSRGGGGVPHGEWRRGERLPDRGGFGSDSGRHW